MALLLSSCVGAENCNEEILAQAPLFKDLIEQSIVSITCMTQKKGAVSFAESFAKDPTSMGTGFVIGPDLIATNAHVVNSEKGEISVFVTTANGQEYSAEILGVDVCNDLALLRIPSGHNLKPLVWADSDAIELGQRVWAIGSPLGLDGTVTKGIVSHKGRQFNDCPDVNRHYQWIQTDAPITHGNSGGPLVNARGEVVGINTMGMIFTSLSFAIPSNFAKRRFQNLSGLSQSQKKYVGLRPGQILTEQDLKDLKLIQDSMKVEKAILINDVIAGSPSQRSGLKPGDMVTHIHQKPLKSKADLFLSIQNVKSGQNLVLQGINQTGQPCTWIIQVEDYFDDKKVPQEKEKDFLRVKLIQIPQEETQINGYKEPGTAIVVIENNGNAHLECGDRVLDVNNIKIKSLAHFIHVMEQLLAKKQRKAIFHMERTSQGKTYRVIPLNARSDLGMPKKDATSSYAKQP